jgi:hypothetical protein
MPLTWQIGGDEVGGEKFPVATYLCNTAADSVGVVDDDGESAPAEDPLGRVAFPGLRQRQIDSQASEFGHLPEPNGGGGAGVLRPAKAREDADLRRARLREWHDRTMDGACIDCESDLVQACALSLLSVHRH